MTDKEQYEARGKKKTKGQSSSQSSGMLVKLFSNTIGFYISLAIYYPFSWLFENPDKLIGPYVKRGQVVADLGCGLGNYTLAMAESVGPEGKVYAVDLDERCIQRVEKKAKKAGYHNIELQASSAAKLTFIKDKSVDFILANGLL